MTSESISAEIAVDAPAEIAPGENCPGEKGLDPRIRRTRTMLREALLALLESGAAFDSISIQAIAEKAGVNRATFYAHYIDREALLEDLIQNQFAELLQARQVRFEGTCPSALRVVILAVYDFIKRLGSGCRTHRRHFEPFVQSVVQEKVEQVLRKGLAKGAFQLTADPSLVAATLSWAIYGAAISSLRREETAAAQPASADQFVDGVYTLLLPLLVPGGNTVEHPE